MGITCVGLKAFYVGRIVVSNLGVHRRGTSVRYMEASGVVLRRHSDNVSLEDTVRLVTQSQSVAMRLGSIIHRTTHVVRSVRKHYGR